MQANKKDSPPKTVFFDFFLFYVPMVCRNLFLFLFPLLIQIRLYPVLYDVRHLLYTLAAVKIIL